MAFLDAIGSWLSLRSCIVLAGLWLLYKLLCTAYNISPLHPLYQFPGPRVASASYLYEFYFDVLLWGKFTLEIGRMHEVYGQLLRIQTRMQNG